MWCSPLLVMANAAVVDMAVAVAEEEAVAEEAWEAVAREKDPGTVCHSGTWLMVWVVCRWK